jgi:hypothetical protein
MVWQRQSTLSQAANQLKADIRKARIRNQALMVGGAILSAASAQVLGWHASLGRGLAGAAAVSLAMAPILGRSATSTNVRDWTRLRSASEALKTEVYTYLAGVTPYRRDDKVILLQDRVQGVVNGVADLAGHVAGLQPLPRSLPDVHDVDSFITERVDKQIRDYYRDNAAKLRRRLANVRKIEIALALAAAALAALATTVPALRLTLWVGVLTTVSSAVVAHVAAERYEYQQVEFARTADELENLRARYRSSAPDQQINDEFVAACERIISIQNEGWMAKITNHVTDA